MDSHLPPSPTRPQPDSFTTDDTDSYHQESNPHSFSAVIGNRPVSWTETEPHNPKTIEPPVNITAPGLTDVAPNKGHSYYEENSSRDMNQDSDHHGPVSFGAVFGERGKSEYNDVNEYENVKTPSQGDVRPVDDDYEYDEGDEYQMNSAPKSYNGDHFGKFKW